MTGSYAAATQSNRAAWWITLLIAMSASHIYELIEWGAAEMFGGELGAAYVGTQGDEWDAQKDMALATVGTLDRRAVRHCSCARRRRRARAPLSRTPRIWRLYGVRVHRRAGSVPRRRAPFPQRQIADDRSASSDGHRRRITTPTVWRQLADDLALTGIHIPEAYGGAGFGPVELASRWRNRVARCCARRTSRRACSPPARYCTRPKTNRKPICCRRSQADRSRAALAVTEPNGRWDTAGIQAVATRTGSGWVIDGEKSYVIDGCSAQQLIVVARAAGSTGDAGLSFFVVDPDAARRHSHARSPRWMQRASRRRSYSHAPRRSCWGNPGAGAEPLSRTLDHAAIALANEMVGGAQALLDSAVAYANIRVQFGRAIGSFQAIKHKCADMLLDVELAKSAAYYAAQAAAEGDPQTPGLRRDGESRRGGRVHARRREHDSDPRRHRLHVG